MRTFKKKSKKNITLLTNIPTRIIVQEGAPATLIFESKIENATCLHCENALCMQAEVSSNSNLGFDFAAELSTEICPTHSIIRNSKEGTYKIDTKTCIGCGLCAARCPIGAIYYRSDEGVFKINDEKYSYTQEEEKNSNYLYQFNLQIQELLKLTKEGCFLAEEDNKVSALQRKVSELKQESQNLFVKNLLKVLGCSCEIRRVGNNYFRMDGLISSSSGKSCSPLEIEYGDDALSAIRLILDDIAVLHSRYNIPKTEQEPLVIFHHLPRGRQGYWQVCQDIYKVTGIKVKTLTILVLIILMWNNKKLSNAYNFCFLDSDKNDLKDFVENSLERSLELTSSVLGFLFPEK